MTAGEAEIASTGVVSGNGDAVAVFKFDRAGEGEADDEVTVLPGVVAGDRSEFVALGMSVLKAAVFDENGVEPPRTSTGEALLAGTVCA